MFPEPFVCDFDIVNTDPNKEVTFNIIGWPGGAGSVRKNIATDEGLMPEWLKISHQQVGKGNALRDRHLVRFEVSSTDENGNVGTSIPAVAYAVFDIPRYNCAANTPTILARMLAGFIRTANSSDASPDYSSATANMKKFLNGEI